MPKDRYDDDSTRVQATGRPDWRPATLMVRGGLERTPFSETSEALFLNSGYVYATAEEAEASFNGDLERYVYSRYANPTLTMLEQRLAALEGAAACRLTSSGMAAVFAALACQIASGDRVVASRALFGSSLHILDKILPTWGIHVDLVDATDNEAWEEALARPAKVVLIETPANPTLDLVDLARVAAHSRAAGARLIVDNVFATPLYQRPLELGADIVVYSTTKHLDGQGRCLGGAVLADETFIKDELTPFLRHTGPALSPFNAWVTLKGVETLSLRVDRMAASAARLADVLADSPAVSRTRYPGRTDHPQHALARRQMTGFGSLVAFDLAGGKEAAFRFLNALRLVDISNNLGDAKSLACHPATTTHARVEPEERARLGIGDGLLRLSVGLEDPEDLASDVQAALDRAR